MRVHRFVRDLVQFIPRTDLLLDALEASESDWVDVWVDEGVSWERRENAGLVLDDLERVRWMVLRGMEIAG